MFRRWFLRWLFATQKRSPRLFSPTDRLETQLSSKPAVNGTPVDTTTPAGQRVRKAADEFEQAMDGYLASVGERS